MLVEPTGYGVRGEYRPAGDAKSLPDPDVIAVAPAAFNAEHPVFPPSLRGVGVGGVHVLEQAPSLVGSGWRPGRPSLGGREACPPASILNEGRPGHQRAHQALLGAGVGCPSPSSPSSSDAPRAGFPQVERAVRLVDRLSTVIELSRVLRMRVDRPDPLALSLAPSGGADFEAVDRGWAVPSWLQHHPHGPSGTITRSSEPSRSRSGESSGTPQPRLHCPAWGAGSLQPLGAVSLLSTHLYNRERDAS